MATDESLVTDLTRGIYRRIYACFLHGRRINSVSMEAEAFFWRLNAIADDFGNFRANPPKLVHEAAPERDLKLKQIEDYMAQLIKSRLVETYEDDGRQYGHIAGFVEMQPAGKNGRRIKKVPEWPGESKAILVNPGESKGILNERVQSGFPHTHNQDHSQNHSQTQAKESGGKQAATALAGGLAGGTPKRVLEACGVREPSLSALTRCTAITADAIKGEWATIIDDPKVKDRPAVLVTRLTAAHGVKLPGKNKGITDTDTLRAVGELAKLRRTAAQNGSK